MSHFSYFQPPGTACVKSVAYAHALRRSVERNHYALPIPPSSSQARSQDDLSIGVGMILSERARDSINIQNILRKSAQKI